MLTIDDEKSASVEEKSFTEITSSGFSPSAWHIRFVTSGFLPLLIIGSFNSFLNIDFVSSTFNVFPNV